MVKPRRLDHLIEHQLEHETLLYDPVEQRTHRLNATASVIWHHCSGEYSTEQLATLLTRDFDVELDMALVDTRALLDQLAREKLITCGEPNEQGQTPSTHG